MTPSPFRVSRYLHQFIRLPWLILLVVVVTGCSRLDSSDSEAALASFDAGVIVDEGSPATPAQSLVDEVKARFRYADPKTLPPFAPNSAKPSYQSYLGPSDGTTLVVGATSVRKAHRLARTAADVALPVTADGVTAL